jgi:hypothetical protein
MSQSSLLSKVLSSSGVATVLAASVLVLSACGSGSGDTTDGGTASSSSSSSSSTSSSTSSSSSSGTASSSGGTTPSAYALKVAGGQPTDQFACTPSALSVGAGNQLANLTWLGCVGGSGATISVGLIDSKITIVYGNASEGFVTFETTPGVQGKTVLDNSARTIAIDKNKLALVAGKAQAGSRGTTPALPKTVIDAGIEISGTLKF